MDLALVLADDDEELAIFNMLLNSSDRNYHYLKRRIGKFDLNELDESYCFTHFRFYKDDIRTLVRLFEIPREVILNNGISVSGEEAMCVLLRRLAYPNRLVDLMEFFPRGRSALSAIFNAMVRHILSTKGHLLEDLNQLWLSPIHVRALCQSVAQKNSPYTRCFAFLDGTVRSICRPVINQRQFYNGHKRVHALKFQSLMLPNGIIANMYGPVCGRRHDGHVLAASGLIVKLERKFDRFVTPPYIYADTGYPLKKYLMVPFKRRLDRRKKFINKQMSKLRVSVEWGFSKIIQLFPFLDFKKNLKVYKQEVGNFYKVGAILTNCHTCLYGSQVSTYFDCNPPHINEYLAN